MLGLTPFQFRFRGKQGRLLDLCACFIENNYGALHPTQLARKTGMTMLEVSKRLDQTPELFVKLPRRPDGITRYRMTSAMAVQSEADIETFIHHRARRESWLLYAAGLMLLLGFLLAVAIIGPVV